MSFLAVDPYARERAPDYGLYLDERWQPPWAHDHVDWPDFGVPSEPAHVIAALRSLLDRARAGERVEVGCLGGHGRTGTALACLAVLGGHPPSDAVAWVRHNYCARAVETAEQEAFVVGLGGRQGGLSRPLGERNEMNKLHLEFLASPEWAEMLRTDLLPWLDGVADLGGDVLEVGPGPGLTTDLLRQRTAQVTAVEVDGELAAALADRLAGTNVEVIHGDGTRTGLPADRFSAATCFAVLHHMPSAELQDRLFAELCRVLRPGAVFVGTDSRDLDAIRATHEDDVFVPVDPDTLPARLETAGFADVGVEVGEYQIRFNATKR